MRNALPYGHGLDERILSVAELLPTENGTPSITDIQYEALEAGIGQGASVLVSAPTSTGKTLIGWWTIASAILNGNRAVYLVSHRALAKQKFEEAQRLFLGSFLGNDRSSIVCATGDGVEDAAGKKTNAPMSATILIATYEKFLGCLSVGGPPRDLRNVCFVCDEVQLIGDEHRGQNTELLLTLMRRAGWHQFVGLSAVLSANDAQALSEWLNVAMVRNPTREKSLRIECRSGTNVHSISSGPGFEGDEHVAPLNGGSANLSGIVSELVAAANRSPVIVFCMKVDDTYDHANAWAARQSRTMNVQPPTGLDVEPQLLRALERRVAYHNAELTEEERLFVETCLARREVDVVFATSTLAAGVNFPLGSAVFSKWTRWDFDRKEHRPIGRAEFQNMAGRVGRMGQDAIDGLVVLTANGNEQINQARFLMQQGGEEALGTGISSDDFGQLALQLFAGRLCTSRDDAFSLIASTLTATREAERNLAGVEHWRDQLFDHIDRLIGLGCLTETASEVSVTTFGLAVARTGLKPETAQYFVRGLHGVAAGLSQMLPGNDREGREDDLLFVLANAALRSPEFNNTAGKAARIVNWRVGRNGAVPNDYASRLGGNLFDPDWASDASAANGALLVTEWAAGTSRPDVERLVDGVRLGTVQSVARDVAWVLTGISDIIFNVTSPNLADESKPELLRGHSESVRATRQLARSLRRQAIRVGVGLPSDVLWMSELELQGASRRLSRKQILSMRSAGLVHPMQLMDGSAEADQRREAALSPGMGMAVPNIVRNAARSWKTDDRAHWQRIHQRRAERVRLQDVILALYQGRGDALEAAFEDALGTLAISFQKLDEKGKQAHPDYLISIENYDPIIVELKSKQNETDFVSLNGVTEVLAASELIGYRESFCVTLCNPAVEPSVPAIIEGCQRLSVVEISDLAEAFLRLAEGTLTRQSLQNWLTTPGIADWQSLPPP